jgi:cbb3-type cytochrome oxidase maturation protein
MNVLLFLIPIALLLGGMGLLGFFWSLRTRQFEDLEGASYRILFDETENKNQST